VTHRVDLYWSFRSPYSYIVVPRLLELERDWDAAVNVKPVLPIAVRQPEFFSQADPLWTSYLMRDCVRSAEFAGMTLRWPRPDPVVMDYSTRTYPAEQPYIHRLTRLGVLAAERGRGLAVLRTVSHLIWSGYTDNWHEGDHLARAFAEAGCDLAELDAAQAREATRLDAAIAQNAADQRSGGHYGVPLMVYAGEPFFGQDRYDQLLWRMQQNGLARR
jgi:2-hydroxychromene-2-carboxylate isomerase